MTIEQARKIKINDIVICNTSFNGLPQKGWKGKVICKNPTMLSIGVEWEDRFPLGHNCNSRGELDQCRYYGSKILDKNSSSIYILDVFNEQLEFEF